MTWCMNTSWILVKDSATWQKSYGQLPVGYRSVTGHLTESYRSINGRLPVT